jgi:hypothetical protein
LIAEITTAELSPNRKLRVHHSKVWRTGKIMQEMAQHPETTHKPLTFANLGQIELGSGLAHPVGSDAGTNGATRRLRSELEADVTKMMKVPQLKVSGGFRQKRYEPSEKQLAAGVGSQRAHHGTVTGLTGPLGRRAGLGRSGHGVASHHGTHGLRGRGLSGRRNDVI